MFRRGRAMVNHNVVFCIFGFNQRIPLYHHSKAFNNSQNQYKYTIHRKVRGLCPKHAIFLTRGLQCKYTNLLCERMIQQKENKSLCWCFMGYTVWVRHAMITLVKWHVILLSRQMYGWRSNYCMHAFVFTSSISYILIMPRFAIITLSCWPSCAHLV